MGDGTINRNYIICLLLESNDQIFKNFHRIVYANCPEFEQNHDDYQFGTSPCIHTLPEKEEDTGGLDESRNLKGSLSKPKRSSSFFKALGKHYALSDGLFSGKLATIERNRWCDINNIQSSHCCEIKAT